MNKITIVLILVSLFGCSKKEEPAQPTVLIATPNGIFDQNGRPVVIQNASGQWTGSQQQQLPQQDAQAQAQQLPPMTYLPQPAQQPQVPPPVHSTVPDNSGITTGEVIGAAALAAAAGAAGYMAGKNKTETYRPQEPVTYQPHNVEVQKPVSVPQASVKPTTVVEAAKPKIESNMVQSGPAVTMPSMKSQVPVTQAAASTAYSQQQGAATKPMQAAAAVKPAPVVAPAPTFKSAPINLPQTAPSPSRWSSPPAPSRSFSSSSSYISSSSRR